MNVADALNSRFTCRAFKPDPVDKEKIIKIIETAHSGAFMGEYSALGSIYCKEEY